MTPDAQQPLRVRFFSASKRAGSLSDAGLRARFEGTVEAVRSRAEAAEHRPRVERAWVEFLGAPPGTGADRVDPVAS